MKNFRDFSVAAKLYTGFGAVLALLLIVTYMANRNLGGTVSGFENAINEDIAMQIANADISRYMLEARRAEKDFLARLDIKYVAAVEESVAKLTTKARALVELEQTGGDKDDADKAADIVKDAETYLAAFKAVACRLAGKGAGSNSGLQGKFREAAHALETLLADNNDLKLKVDLLTIRRKRKRTTCCEVTPST